ncbi:MAG: hypothetical protein K0R92_854 [Lachnospiraceae bacterium]|jgi:hypothetical protein|nr:hypothetical protein [Anaerocolumna sp.]MDF2609380.1 hypothetical protein [Lachnospiraceae bacterium]
MKQCLSVCEAIKIAEFTGQVVRITLRSGTEFTGIVEKVCPTAFRLWIRPEEETNGDVVKAWIATHAVESVAFDEENIFHDRFCRLNNCGSIQGIREALNAALLTEQVVMVGLFCHKEPVVLVGTIIKVCPCTFCIDLIGCPDKREERIENVEYVKFS